MIISPLITPGDRHRFMQVLLLRQSEASVFTLLCVESFAATCSLPDLKLSLRLLNSFMDRNTIIGFILIALLVIAYSIYNTPSKEQLAQEKHVRDSVALAEKQKRIADSLQALQQQSAADTSRVTATIQNSSTALFSDSSVSEQSFTIENDLLKLTLSNRGGSITSVELKKYKTYNQTPLILFSPENTSFNYLFYVGNEAVETNQILFRPEGKSFSVTGADSNSIAFRAYISPTRYIEQRYSLKGNSLKVDYQFSMQGMDSVIRNTNSYINLVWDTRFNHTEHDLANERNYSSAYMRYTNEDVDGISEHSTGDLRAAGKVQWVSCKTHFFNATLITSAVPFDQGTISSQFEESGTYVKQLKADMVLPFENKSSVSYPMEFYFGANNYQDLKKLRIELEKIIPLGAGLFGAISSPLNKYFFIPMFNWLDNYISSYGLIIVIMTFMLRIVLYPLTYRSFVSAAKMRVLKPEIDELRAKYADDQARFGQEQMKLFRQAGVNPLGGCIPLLLQLPILAAMYTFFPQSIELRQQCLWWVKDLSTYDSVLSFNFNIPFYGNHVSLWTIIMTITSIAFAVYNNQLSGVQGQMKWMAYIMPVMLLGIFNSLPAALTYYYSVSNVAAFLQQYLIKNFVIDEDKIHRQIQENKKKPVKKSKWQQRFEDLQRQQTERGRPKK